MKDHQRPDLNALGLANLFAALVDSPGNQRSSLHALLELARDEDLGAAGDLTTQACIDPRRTARAGLVARQELVIAGLRCLPALLDVLAPTSQAVANVHDGERVAPGAILARLEGPMHEILALERTMLNLLSRLSGIASHAWLFVEQAQGTLSKIYDTRKSTPGLRVLEKYAVRCGGANCHRIGLFDALLIKDNHLVGVSLEELPSFVAAAVQRARQIAARHHQALWFAELEVDSLEQFERILQAGGCGLDVVLLDNMTLEDLETAVAMRRHSRISIELEASGGVRLETVRAIALTGVERISAGSITHGAVARDIALDFTT